MTSIPDGVRDALKLLEDKLAEREAAVIEAKKQINQFCQLFDLPPQYDDVGEVRKAGLSFRPDEFANHRSPGEAVRHLLKLVGGAVEITRVYKLLRDHGFPFDHRATEEKHIAGLRIAIGKDRKLQRHAANDNVGLAAWYPNRRRPKGKSEDVNSGDVGEDVDDDIDDGEAIDVDVVGDHKEGRVTSKA